MFVIFHLCMYLTIIAGDLLPHFWVCEHCDADHLTHSHSHTDRHDEPGCHMFNSCFSALIFSPLSCPRAFALLPLLLPVFLTLYMPFIDVFYLPSLPTFFPPYPCGFLFSVLRLPDVIHPYDYVLPAFPFFLLCLGILHLNTHRPAVQNHGKKSGKKTFADLLV